MFDYIEEISKNIETLLGYYITGFSFIESGIIISIFKTSIYTLNLFLAINIRVPVFSSIGILKNMLHTNIILVLCTYLS